jgi:hypothetical protein
MEIGLQPYRRGKNPETLERHGRIYDEGFGSVVLIVRFPIDRRVRQRGRWGADRMVLFELPAEELRAESEVSNRDQDG